MLFDIKELEKLSKDEILDKINEFNSVKIHPKTNNNFDLDYFVFFDNPSDEHGDNPYVVKITVDPIIWMEKGLDSSIISYSCKCKGYTFRKGEIKCKHINKSLKLIELNKC